MIVEPEAHHVFAWISGFGWTVVPFAPFRFERRGDGLRVEHQSGAGPKAAVIMVTEGGQGYDAALEPGTSVLGEVADVFDGPLWDEWRVNSDALHCRWPKGFAFVSLPGTKPPLFEWEGPDGSSIWLQGPMNASTLPSPDKMGTPDQHAEQITALTNGPLVEFTYQHEGRSWRMFQAVHCPGAPAEEPRGLLRWLKPRPASTLYALVVSAQTPERHSAIVRTAVIEIAESLTPASIEAP